jgi:hypothetical protein
MGGPQARGPPSPQEVTQMPARPPVVCAQCGGVNIRRHCKSPTCCWVSCTACGFITGMMAGIPHAIPGKGAA